MFTFLKKISNKKRNISIITRIFATAVIFLIMLLISEIFISYCFYNVSYKQHIDTAHADFEYCYDNLLDFESSVNQMAFLLQTDYEIQNLLTEIDQNDLSLNEHQIAISQLSTKLYLYQGNTDEYTLNIYINSPLDLQNNSSRVISIDKIKDQSWVKDIMNGWGNWRYVSTAESQLENPILAFPLRNMHNYLNLMSLLVVNINSDPLSQKITAPRSAEYVTCYLQTSDQTPIVSSTTENLSFTIEASEDSLKGFESYNLNSLKSDENIVLYQSLPKSDWRLVMVIDHAKIHSLIFPQLLILTIVGCIIAALGLLCIIPILFSTISHIRRFHQYVVTYNHNPLTIIPPNLEITSNDEIGQLIEAHNSLLANIRQLMEDRKIRQEELRTLEISVLQEQINPHFLYNTLESIIWMARLNKPDKIEFTIRNLTSYYRLCLNKGKKSLTVAQEIEIAQKYLAIQTTKYEKNVNFIVDVPQEILDMKLPKITIQPLVENALIHGIFESDNPSDDNQIKICGEILHNHAKLYIKDSGAHFSQEIWEKALKPELADSIKTSGSGYGLYNVERRLCLYFKKDHVMYLDNSDHRETSIVIPMN